MINYKRKNINIEFFKIDLLEFKYKFKISIIYNNIRHFLAILYKDSK